MATLGMLLNVELTVLSVFSLDPAAASKLFFAVSQGFTKQFD
jgi:hypothetical protein